jgi:tetratricopeptide (TPR) repeat protein
MRHQTCLGEAQLTLLLRARMHRATAFVHLNPPKHHQRARRILDTVLAKSPDDVACLLGKGYVLENAGRWKEAVDLFNRALKQDNLPEMKRIEAREERAGLGQVHKAGRRRGRAEARDLIARREGIRDRRSGHASPTIGEPEKRTSWAISWMARNRDDLPSRRQRRGENEREG